MRRRHAAVMLLELLDTSAGLNKWTWLYQGKRSRSQLAACYDARRGASLSNGEYARTRRMLSSKELPLTALCSFLQAWTLLEAGYFSKFGAPCEPFVALCVSVALTALNQP